MAMEKVCRHSPSHPAAELWCRISIFKGGRWSQRSYQLTPGQELPGSLGRRYSGVGKCIRKPQRETAVFRRSGREGQAWRFGMALRVADSRLLKGNGLPGTAFLH